MTRYTPWETYGPFRSSHRPSVSVPDRYAIGRPRGGSGTAATFALDYSIAPSFAAHLVGAEPPYDLDARLCAQAHAANADSGGFLGWEPGECPPLGTDPTNQVGPNSDPDAMFTHNVPVGTYAYWEHPAFRSDIWFHCQVQHSAIGFGLSGPTSDPYLGVSADALTQVESWLPWVSRYGMESLDYSFDPQIDLVRVDAIVKLSAAPDQPDAFNTFTVSAHPRTDGLLEPGLSTLHRYSEFSGAAFSCSTAPNASGPEIRYDDITSELMVGFDLSSSRVMDGIDPGTNTLRQAEANIGHMRWFVDFEWTFKLRFPIPDIEPVLRWRQRDDGLGVGATARHKTGTSIQSTLRHRGYR